MARSVAGSRKFTTVLSRKATIDTMIATAITLLVGATTTRENSSEPKRNEIDCTVGI
jgi:hypothetical protein